MTSEPSCTARRLCNHRPGGIECSLAALIFLTGLGLRFAWPSHLAVEHFDEGVYASNLFFLDAGDDERYPDQHLFAPPLLPALIEIAMSLSAPSNAAAMAVSLIAGSLTIPLVWWVSRRWYGPEAGLASSTLAAVSDVHIFFSRAALTDVLLCFWLIAAVYFLWEGLAGRSRLALVAAGIITGLAWWTKYNGWLPLAIGFAGLIPWSILEANVATDSRPGPSKRIRRLSASVAQWAFVAGLAFLIWSPFLRSLEGKGGYAAVAANHRTYLVGLSGWWNSLIEQAGKLAELDGWASIHGPPIAIAICLAWHCLSKRRFTWNLRKENRRAFIAMPVAVGMAGLAGSSVVTGLAAAIGIAVMLFRRVRAEDGRPAVAALRLAGWLLAAWHIGLFLTTPLYTPYPRLALPWLASCWFGTGILIGALTGRENVQPEVSDAIGPPDREPAVDRSIPTPTASRRSADIILLAVIVIACAGFEWLVSRSSVPGWESRTGMLDAVPQVLKAIHGAPSLAGQSEMDSFVVYTYGEPAALFQLRLAGVRWVRPVKDLDMPRSRVPTFVLFGRQALLTPGFSEQLADRRDRLHFVARIPYRRSRLVTLDEPRASDSREAVLELYEVR